MKKLICIALISLFTTIVYATSFPTVSLDEVFGTTTCGACVAMYRELDELYPTYADSAVVLKFIGGTTPDEVRRGRLSHYFPSGGTIGVPYSFVNGVDHDNSVASYIVQQMLADARWRSPFNISLSRFRPGCIAIEVFTDSLEFGGSRAIVGFISQDSANSYPTKNIVIDTITSPNGDSVYLVPGVVCTLEYEITTYPLEVGYKTYAVFFIQDWQGTTVYNTFRTDLRPRMRFDFLVKTPEGKRKLCSAGDIIRIPIKIENWGTQDDTYKVRLQWINQPPGWEAYFSFPGEPLEKDIFITAFHDSTILVEVVASFMEDARFRVFIRTDSIPEREDTLEFRVGAGGQALLVCNSPTPEDSIWYINFMNARGIDYFYWDVSHDGPLTEFAQNGYSYVVWFCGLDTTKNIWGEMRQEIGRYLFSYGGKLLITGSGIGRVNYAVSNFLQNGLGARFDSAIVDPNSVSGVAGHFTGFYSGFTELPTAEVIHTSTPGAQIVLTYPDGSGAGVAYESQNDGHRCVWLAFQPERMTNEARFGSVMLRAWEFLEEGWTGIKELVLPKAHSIMVFPNPVNITAKIYLPSPDGKLTVYDISGKIVEETQVQTRSSVLVDFSHLPVGIYLVKYKFGKNTLQTKIAVVK